MPNSIRCYETNSTKQVFIHVFIIIGYRTFQGASCLILEGSHPEGCATRLMERNLCKWNWYENVGIFAPK